MMQGIRNIFRKGGVRPRPYAGMSDFFLRASDAEKMGVIRKAAERANKEQANVMILAAKIGSKAKN